MTIEKLDLRKQLKHLYNPPSKKVVEVTVPAMNFLMLDGSGDPNTALEYQQALEALYGLSYALKFTSKKDGIDYAVMPLEGLWWMDNMGEQYGDVDFTADKNRWQWTMMILQPDHITQAMVKAAITELGRKKNPPALDKMRFARFHEGLSAQVMHIGPYSAEKPTIDRLHTYIAEQGYEPSGKHHEIYLGDPRRTQPEKLRTVIRQPMSK
jgi:hypothetical protein